MTIRRQVLLCSIVTSLFYLLYPLCPLSQDKAEQVAAWCRKGLPPHPPSVGLFWGPLASSSGLYSLFSLLYYLLSMPSSLLSVSLLSMFYYLLSLLYSLVSLNYSLSSRCCSSLRSLLALVPSNFAAGHQQPRPCATPSLARRNARSG